MGLCVAWENVDVTKGIGVVSLPPNKRGSTVVYLWTSTHWVAGLNPLRGMFHH